MKELAFPGLDLFNLYQLFLMFFFASLRVAAFLLSSPFFSTSFFSMQIRIVMSISIALFIFPEVKIPNITELNTMKVIILILSEIGIGVSVGLVLSILFSVASVTGEKIASTAGLSMANMIDPQTGGQTLVISTVLALFLIFIFLTLDGHLYVLKMIIESYEYLPIGIALNLSNASDAGIQAFGKMLYLAALIMLPVVGGMLLINFSGGIVTRAAPTLNLFSFIFPVTLISVFIFLFMALSTIANGFSDVTGIGINLIDNLLHSLNVRSENG